MSELAVLCASGGRTFAPVTAGRDRSRSELIEFGAQGAFGPLFTPGFTFRPGIDFGLGEVTTTFGVNLDGIYTFGGATTTSWTPTWELVRISRSAIAVSTRMKRTISGIDSISATPIS